MAGLLYPGELRDASEWVNQTAQCIVDSVKRAEGWRKVFESGIPPWLHKLRNFFNVEPVTLRLLDKGVSDYWMARIEKYGQLSAPISGSRTLSRDVYADQNNRIWYQMGPGGSIFHWGEEVDNMYLEAGFTHAVRGQTGIPIFKLISPDGTRGSRETIVSNPMDIAVVITDTAGTGTLWKGKSRIGGPGETVHVRQMELHITTMEHQGSYNFAETAVIGRDWHTKFDVETHQKDRIYIDPPDRFLPLTDRVFTETLLQRAGADTRRKVRDMRDTRLDLDEPPIRRTPTGVSNPH